MVIIITTIIIMHVVGVEADPPSVAIIIIMELVGLMTKPYSDVS